VSSGEALRAVLAGGDANVNARQNLALALHPCQRALGFARDVVRRKPRAGQVVELRLVAVIQKVIVESQQLLLGTSRKTVEPALRMKLAYRSPPQLL